MMGHSTSLRFGRAGWGAREAWFQVSHGQPVIPSKISKRIYWIGVDLGRILDLSVPGKLAALGMNVANDGRLPYVQRMQDYPAPQQIAEIAFFYEYEALVVPNARWPTSNVVLFTGNTRPAQIDVLDGEPVDLAAWNDTARAGKL